MADTEGLGELYIAAQKAILTRLAEGGSPNVVTANAEAYKALTAQPPRDADGMPLDG